jgi:hypothetical protein
MNDQNAVTPDHDCASCWIMFGEIADRLGVHPDELQTFVSSVARGEAADLPRAEG